MDRIGPCAPGVVYAHIIIAAFSGLNLLLTTWLTGRARRQDREDNGSTKKIMGVDDSH